MYRTQLIVVKNKKKKTILRITPHVIKILIVVIRMFVES
jgi:hypothetical protein